LFEHERNVIDDGDCNWDASDQEHKLRDSILGKVMDLVEN